MFTGLRPGEKLFEELLTEGEGIMETGHEKIRIAAPVEVDPDTVAADLEHLFRLAEKHDYTEWSLPSPVGHGIHTFQPLSLPGGAAQSTNPF